jgi:hypothetical protein
MDWVLKRTEDGCQCGLKWTEEARLMDLDFADDIALLDSNWNGVQELTHTVEVEAAKVGLRINVDKTKVMEIGQPAHGQAVHVGGTPIEKVSEFTYLGSVLVIDSSCDKEIKTRLGRANATFGRLENIWKSKAISCRIKIRLYNSLVLPTLLYGAETWSMTVANMKRLEAAHHKWQRKILG